jgi:hypothetical protein
VSDVSVNARYGRWVVLSTDTSTRRASCRCDCGTVQQVTFNALLTGGSQGCYHCARRRERAEASPSHLPDWRPQR